MALSANSEIRFLEPAMHRVMNTGLVAGSTHIYAGAFVGKNPAGYFKAFQAGDEFVGIAEEEFYNSSATAGAASALGNDLEQGKLRVRVCTSGNFAYTLSSVAITDVGKPVFATDDGTLSLTGHPDAFVGYITEVFATNKAMIRIRNAGEIAPHAAGTIDIRLDFAVDTFTATGASTVAAIGSKCTIYNVGTLTAGTNGLARDHANGEAVLLHSSTSEVQSLTLLTPRTFNITKGITFEFEGRKSVAGTSTNCNLDFGLAGGIALTTTQFSDMQDTTASFLYALFHIDAEGNDINFCSDNNSTVVSPTDTTIDNSTSTNKTYKIIVRPDGTVEAWISGARVLSSTTFSVGASGLLAGIVNIEKAASTDVAEARVRKLRIAGAFA